MAPSYNPQLAILVTGRIAIRPMDGDDAVTPNYRGKPGVLLAQPIPETRSSHWL